MQFEILARCGTSKARVSKMNGLSLPQFMPVGTKGSVKGLTSKQIRELKCQTILGNTFHLGLDPGVEVMDDYKGLRNFMQYDTHLLVSCKKR